MEDREPIASYLRQFDAYSDFTFASLWAWDIGLSTLVSTLYGNLVVRLADYTTGVPAYSFIGTHRVRDTVEILLERAAAEGLAPQLRLVPACAVAAEPAIFDGLGVSPDRDNFDYIYSPADVVFGHTENGRKARRFATRYSPRTHDLQLCNARVKDTLLKTFETWRLARAKGPDEVAHELSALERALNYASHLRLLGTGVSVGGALVAFEIDDLDHPRYAMVTFAKADTTLVGAYAYLDFAVCGRLASYGYSLWNYEQDLGIPGLRLAKERRHPCSFLMKHTIALNS